jgi:ABC-type multidrug transport system fused ATPase/permease subunit
MFDRVWARQLSTCVQDALIVLAVCGLPLSVVYGLVAAGTAGGHHSVAAETAVLSAGYSVYLMVGTVFNLRIIEGTLPSVRALADLRTALADTALADTALADTALADAGLADTGPPQRAPGASGEPLDVLIEGLCFSYPGSEPQILRDLNLEIRPGELLAIVGLNGAGKSTLIKLLAGLYRPSGGSITAGGSDIFTDLAGWRRQISVVFQDFARYQLSARDNVTLMPADAAALAAAARESGLEELLGELPAGWDTPLARSRTGGVDLSGGQWQQVVLARALYAVHREAWLLVLDEPTAHLDVRTEFEVFQRLAARARGISVVLISHRLSTVRQADRIVLLDGGRVTESGRHDELIELDGAYAAMFALQAERFRLGYDDRIEDGAS